MKKRADGRYQKNVYIGLENGKKKYKSVFGKTQKEVSQKAAELKIKMNKGIDVSAENDTFGAWIDRWLYYKKSLIGESRYKNYCVNVKHFYYLHNVKISRLNVSDFQAVINEYAIQNPTTHKPTAKGTLQKMRNTISQVFDFAIKNRAIDFNPLKYVDIPKDSPKKERRALTKEEQQWVMDTPHRAQLPAIIMMLSGLRLAECLALQWSDIDLQHATINVNKSLKMIDNKSEVQYKTKTKLSKRVVDIPNVLVDFLKSLSNYNLFDYVVTNTKGKLFTRSAWKSMWRSYQKDLNMKYGDFSDYIDRPKSKFQPGGVPFVIDGFTAHYLRHTHATNLFKAGYDVLYIQKQLGHSKPETTLNIYTHLVTDTKKETQSKLDKYLAG